ncbi:GPI mannosyltransferase 4-like isoform X2 [Ruditapes philippinarum]|nr:GPI mannosyltransferase 4-like isoform X2 [Ruditapes philippinarum]
MSYVLLFLLVFRLGWAVLPQSGYIHPDEFFQTVEVVAGDALNISVVQTWEFTSAYPLRSAVLPQILFHPMFKLLKYADERSSFSMTGCHLVTSYRLLMAVLSLWIDICVYKICKVIGLQGHSANVLLASSYVTLTYQTHTFSNSFETLLFVTLILLILICMRKDKINSFSRASFHLDNITDKTVAEGYFEDASSDTEDLNSSLNDLHKNAFNLRNRNKIVDNEVELKREGIFNKPEMRFQFENYSEKVEKHNERHVKDLKKGVQTSNVYIYISVMALVVTVGIFNRPTFVIFAFLPLFWWAKKHPTGEIYVFKRAAVFICTGILLSFVFVIMDTAYFTGFDITSLLSVDGWQNMLKKCVKTPLNFVLYNSMSVNLAEHGYHPFYLHSMVNMPLLFGPMFFYLTRHLINNALILLKITKSDEGTMQVSKTQPRQREDKCQNKLKSDFERMLGIFILFPIMVLSFFPHQEARFLIPLLPLVVISVAIFSTKLSKLFWLTFVVFNLVLSVVFGTLHQGGVIPSLMKLQTMIQKEFQENDSTSITLIYSHTYMPPKHVLLNHMSNLELIDLKGSNFQSVIDEIEKKKISKLKVTNSDVIKSVEKKIFVCIPGSLVEEFKLKCNGLYSIKSEELFFPHLSFEDPPNVTLTGTFESLYDMMSLHLIEID